MQILAVTFKRSEIFSSDQKKIIQNLLWESTLIYT